MTLQVGHGPFRQRSPIPVRRITRFQAVSPSGMAVYLHQPLRLGQGAEDGDFRLNDPGTYALGLPTDHGPQTHLTALRFNHYLEVEGLTPALEQRAQLHRMDADGSERYSRCAKSILQVGPPGAGSQGQINKPVGLPLEIVPEVNPYGAKHSATLPVRVLYAGHALAGALVKLTNPPNYASPFQGRPTGHDGRPTLPLPH